jgi:predicted aspartyl protease
MTPPGLYGTPTETNILLNGKEIPALLDTGSTVSTISESYYSKHLASTIPHDNRSYYPVRHTLSVGQSVAVVVDMNSVEVDMNSVVVGMNSVVVGMNTRYGISVNYPG